MEEEKRQDTKGIDKETMDISIFVTVCNVEKL